MPRLLLILLALAAATACSKDSPPAAPDPGSGTTTNISGRERIGWDQPGDSVEQVSGYSYGIYVDGARNDVTAVACAPGSASQLFACSGKGPDLAVGTHTLELSASSESGEGPRSPALTVVVARAASGTAPSDWPVGSQDISVDGEPRRLEKLVEGLDRPADAAFLPDGRLLIAERSGRVRLVEGGVLQARNAYEPAPEGDAILSLAVDPLFERTRFVFMIHAVRTGAGDVFRLARYREVQGTLGERAILIEIEAPPIADASAVLRAGPGNTLLVAAGAAGFPGILLRLNMDGTRPRDQAGTTPGIAQGLQAPRGLAIDPVSGLIWIADEQGGQAHLTGIAFTGRPLQAVVRARHPLAAAGSMAFYPSGGRVSQFARTLLMASPYGRLDRIRLSDAGPEQAPAVDAILEDLLGPLLIVTAGPDGAMYFCTADALGRLSAPE